MKIYKIADAPFQTFGLEDMVYDSFMRHYQAVTNPKMLEKNQKFLNKEKGAVIGSINIRNYVDKIIEHYGKPKSPIPYQMVLSIFSPKSSEGEKFGATMSHDQGRFELGITLLSPKITDIDTSNLKERIGHELEHFLKAVYRGTASYYNKTKDFLKNPINETGKEYYYNDPREIQAYSKQIALEQIAELENTYKFRVENAPRKAPEIIANMENNKEKITKSMLILRVKKFLNKIEIDTKKQLLPETKKAYYIATMRGFSMLFNEFIQRAKNELV